MSMISGLNTSTVNTNTYSKKVDTKNVEKNKEESVVSESTTEETVATNTAGDTLEISKKSSSDNNESSSNTSTKSSKIDQAELDKIMAEAQKEAEQLTNFINKVMNNQGKNSVLANADSSTDSLSGSVEALQSSVLALKEGLENGTISVDQETIDKAKELTSEDGYYGVKQTSERIVNAAKALSGGDTSKADILREAAQKAFDEVAEMWGGMENAPQITKDTYDAVMQGFDDWVNGTATA